MCNFPQYRGGIVPIRSNLIVTLHLPRVNFPCVESHESDQNNKSLSRDPI